MKTPQMDSGFPTRYLQIMKSVSAPSILEQRWAAVASTAADLNKASALRLVSFLRGASSDDAKEMATEMAKRVQENDITFSLIDNSRELEVLAEEVVARAFAVDITQHDVVDVLALSLVTSDVCGLARPLRRRALVETAADYLVTRQMDVRRRPGHGVKPLSESFPAAVKAGEFTDDQPLYYSTLAPVLEAMIKDNSVVARAAGADLAFRVRAIEEQMAVMDLYLTGFSSAVNASYGSLGPRGPIVAARDLDYVTAFLPGLRDARRYFSIMIAKTKNRILDFLAMIEAATADDLSAFAPVPVSSVSTPLNFVIEERRQDRIHWKDALSDDAGVKWTPIRALDLSVQLYLERILYRTMNG